MVTESIVVIVLTLVLSYLYVRRGKRAIAISILPLAVLPLFCIAGYLLRNRLPMSLLPAGQWGILFVMVGLLAGGSLFGSISRNIQKTSVRRMYLLLCGGFTILFAFAEILAVLRIL